MIEKYDGTEAPERKLSKNTYILMERVHQLPEFMAV